MTSYEWIYTSKGRDQSPCSMFHQRSGPLWLRVSCGPEPPKYEQSLEAKRSFVLQRSGSFVYKLRIWSLRNLMPSAIRSRIEVINKKPYFARWASQGADGAKVWNIELIEGFKWRFGMERFPFYKSKKREAEREWRKKEWSFSALALHSHSVLVESEELFSNRFVEGMEIICLANVHSWL